MASTVYRVQALPAGLALLMKAPKLLSGMSYSSRGTPMQVAAGMRIMPGFVGFVRGSPTAYSLYLGACANRDPSIACG